MSATMLPLTGYQRKILFIAILASFVSILDGSVVNLALPAINRELGGGLSSQQWIVDAYMLTLGALILVAGSLSDLFGRVRVLMVGLIGFGATSVLCGIATSDVMLILARGLQGVAGALLVPSSLALIIAAFSGPAQSKAIGQWTAWTGASTLVAPLVGGVAVDFLSWRFVFFINLLPILICLPLLWSLRSTDASRDPAIKVDWLGAVLAVVGLGGVVYAMIEQGSFGWGSPFVLIPLVLGVLALIGFVLHERRAAQPMMPLTLFSIRNFWVGNISTLFIYGALSLGFFTLGLYLQQVAHLSATIAGIALLPATVLMLLFSSWFGSLSGKFGPRLFMGAGPVLAGLGFLWLLNLSTDFNYWWQVLPGILLFGLGLAITVAPLTSAILSSVSADRAGIGSAVNNAVARIAGLVTVALAGALLGGVLDTAGARQVSVITALLLIIGGLISAFGIQNQRKSLAE
ncbi:EmrB/QacA subfamily drug resistance transporter [Psychromicrobium silvestre]|uniref:EmrB/QacA subfamily drug resistance transporter n=1 Tax=Psychromicrobium silvestre TaxID=1645614 RepID=A0A7Y9LSN0_9MICC|nr:MFS transporter [Psychromicrobium silvestre]NYE94862.1 EmrB/QacA subfamily drug resistance transporter [Psychromicrobium silvestre]